MKEYSILVVSTQGSMYAKEYLEKVKLRIVKCQKWLKNQQHNKWTKVMQVKLHEA